jgi:hypothetical protein
VPGLLRVRGDGLDIPGMVAHGESDRLQFKEGLKAGQGAEGASRAVGKSLARILCAFMNSRGGTLSVGVADSGEIKGLEPDFAASGLSGRDAWEQVLGRGSATPSPAMPHRVDAAFARIYDAAGNGRRGFSGDGGPARAAQLNLPTAVGIDMAGNLYIADTDNDRIRTVDGRGSIRTLAGGGWQSTVLKWLPG